MTFFDRWAVVSNPSKKTSENDTNTAKSYWYTLCTIQATKILLRDMT